MMTNDDANGGIVYQKKDEICINFPNNKYNNNKI